MAALRSAPSEDGVIVSEVEVSFDSPIKGPWQEGLRTLGVSACSGCNERWLADFQALPKELTPSSYYLDCRIASCAEDPEAAHWTFRMAPIPKSAPPHRVVTSSAKVGGYPGVLARIEEMWPKDGPRTSKYKATMILTHSRPLAAPFFPRPPPSVVNYDGIVGKSDSAFVTWKIEGIDGINELSTLWTSNASHGPRVLAVTSKGLALFAMGPNALDNIRREACQAFARFLEPESKPTPRRKRIRGGAQK